MLNQPLIEGELLHLGDSEFPASVTKQTFQGRVVSVPRAGKEPSAAYIKLCEMIIYHLSRGLVRGGFEHQFQASDHTAQPTVWLTFPALLEAIRNSDKPLPANIFSSLGFDTTLLQEQGSSIESLSRAIRKEDGDVMAALRYTRKNRTKSDLFEETAVHKMLRRSTSSCISLVYIFNMLLMGMFLYLAITQEPLDVRGLVL